MADAAHYALLYRPRVRAHFQHFEIMIGFQQEHVRAAQVILHRCGNVPEIGGDADANALRFEAESDGVDGVVRNAETLDLDIADLKRGARLERLEDGDGNFPVDGWSGEASEVKRLGLLETAR